MYQMTMMKDQRPAMLLKKGIQRTAVIPMTVGQAQRVVNDLVKSCQGSGRNVTTDEYLINLTLLGTMNKGRREVPCELRLWRY